MGEGIHDWGRDEELLGNTTKGEPAARPTVRESEARVRR
jgi:hypothetical protein